MILLHGTGTHNKGAELMAIAVLEHFRARPNPPEFAVPPSFGSYCDRAKYGLWTLLAERRFGRSKLVVSLAHFSFRRKYGLVSERDIVAVLDASGFAFGDQHGPKPTQTMADHCRRWKRQRKKVILLPQAFGPFTSSAIRSACRVLVENCDLVFAREEQSYQHLIDVAGQRSHIRIAPDFTPLVRGIVPEGWQPKDNTVFVVPNMRMLDKTDHKTAERYIPFLADTIKAVLKGGLHAVVLIHTPEDKALVKPIQDACDVPLDVIEETCPLRLKGILGTACAVISSRFHALVGALSQDIPALALGWSHKYAQLMQDYGYPEAVVHVGDQAALTRWLQTILCEGTRKEIRERLNQRNQHLRTRVEEMWSAVDGVLRNRA